MGITVSRLKSSSAQIALAITLSLGLGVSTFVPSEAEAQTIRLNQIVIDGNQRIASETITTLAGLDTRRVYTQGEVNAAVQRLVRTGFFETVDVNIAGNRATIIVDEKPTINRVAFEGNRRRRVAELQTVVESRPRDIFSATQAEADADAIARAYEVNGRIKATITPKIIERSDNRVDLVFEILEGRVSEIERIAFEGNRRFSDARLRSALDSRQAGVFRQLTTRDVFIDERMEVDEANLRRFYTNRGYVDAQVLSSTSDITREADAFLVTYAVEEGQQYRFGEINIVPNTGDINPDDYARVINRLRPGRVYDPREIDRAVADLEAQLNEDGFPFISVQPVPTRNVDDLTISLDIEVNMADRLFIERIEISGNGSTQDQVIRREFGLVEGDPFNRRKVQEATDRIRALGFFSNVDVQAREGTKPGSVIIDVVVEEQPTGSFGVGGSYSSSGGFTANLSVRERNLLGRGLDFRFDISNASDNTTVGIGLTNPSFRGRDVSLGFDIGQTSQSIGDVALDRELLSASVSLGFPLGEDSRLLASAFVRSEEITLDSDAMVGTNLSPTAEVDEGDRLSGGLNFTYTLDRSNSIVNPTSGYILRFTQEFSGGDKQFSKSTAKFTTFRRLRGEDITLRLELEGGHLIYSGGASIITDRFFLGGDSLIGFANRGIGPRDVGVSTNDPLGGNSYAVARAELGFPLGNLESVGISGGVFINAGTVWGLDQDLGTDIQGNDRSIRVAAGFTVFWETPIGPLRFDFARPLVYQEGIDETESFRFSISSRF
ncbi:MAG: outer membrane protein assembly factor BamA [Pseudomonadota bacterium]